MRQWIVPIVLGLAATGITWMMPEIHVPRPQGGVEVRTDAPYVLLPHDDAPDHHVTLLRYNTTHRHGLGGILDVHPGMFRNGSFGWDGTGWECLRHAAACAPSTAAGDEVSPPGAARVDAQNATVELTFYLFTSSGHLLATNAPRSQWDAFDLHGEFTRFSATTWHLGDTRAPAGARTLPVFRAEALALLEGTPVGGVQSAVLERHEYDWLVGPVWATARVEGIA